MASEENTTLIRATLHESDALRAATGGDLERAVRSLILELRLARARIIDLENWQAAEEERAAADDW